MEITTIVGIVIAVIIMVVGICLLFRKPRNAAPSLESELHINEESQKPVIPRHVRNQLHIDAAERVEPTLDEKAKNVESIEASKTEAEQKTPNQQSAEEKLEDSQTVKDVDATTVQTPEEKIETNETALGKTSEVEETATEAQTFSLNHNIDKAEISDFNDESSILDAHLYEQNVVDAECALVTAESFIAFNIVSKGRVLSGEKTLKVLLKYGLRFGEMKCFHRYNDDGSKLLFSVLKLTDEGTEGFDLETLSTEEVKGLACFLALPHNEVQNAFDTMASIAGLIAREIDGVVYDQENYELTPQLREYWRHQAIDYKSPKNARA